MSYAATQDQLLDECDRIEAILATYESDEPNASSETPTPSDETGSTVTGERLIREPAALPLALPAAARQEITKRTEAIREQCRETDETRLRLRVLAETCGLSRRHLDVLMLAMAPELDESFARRFQELQNHQSLDRPTPLFIEDLFARTRAEQIAAGALISSDSPLRQHDLIELQPSPAPAVGSRRQRITVADRIVEYLKGYDGVDPDLDATLSEYARGNHGQQGVVDCEATATVSALAVDDALGERLASLSAADGSHRCYWYGPASEKHRAVEAVCPTDRYLKIDLAAALDAGVLDWLGREAALLGRPLHLYNATMATESPETPTLEAVFDALANLDQSVFVTGRESWTPTETMSTEIDAIIEFPYPSVDLRREFWQSHAAELPDEVEPGVLAGTFRLTHEQLRAALSTARSFADGEALTADDIYTGCRAQSADELAELADRIEPDSEWDEIQVRPETRRKLRLVRTHIAQQARIYDDWGFAEQFSRGTGVVGLFEGPSGTGKTMAAEILAGDLGMDLYRIDLSSVVSKYIGETEENLEEIFEAATNANAILLFDEADAVFGERGEVSDSTDRYANAEVNYLLQRIETYDGVVLLTTNYASAIDSAFQRRLDHTVSFKQPQQSTRSAIWQEIFPERAPLGEIDFEFLSAFEFTGGRIKQIAQTAAILAADEAQSNEPTIEMRHLVRAIQQAFESSGRMVDPSTYEPYQHLLYDGSATGDEDPNHENEREGDTQPPGRSPEAVVRGFVDRLDSGDPAIHDLYHPRAVADPVSRKELRRAKTVDHSIEGDVDRIETASDRVVVAFTQKWDGSTTETTAELRPEDGSWRLFDLQRGASAERVGSR
ncbi:MAG: AAA family ATPase [Euryarchaeota archaeon]|nr:AAA family ATPase [Euryarchaeota archaeon]